MEVSGGLGAAGESRLLFTSKLSQLMRYRINQKTRIMKNTKRTDTTSQGVVIHQSHFTNRHIAAKLNYRFTTTAIMTTASTPESFRGFSAVQKTMYGIMNVTKHSKKGSFLL